MVARVNSRNKQEGLCTKVIGLMTRKVIHDLHKELGHFFIGYAMRFKIAGMFKPCEYYVL